MDRSQGKEAPDSPNKLARIGMFIESLVESKLFGNLTMVVPEIDDPGGNEEEAVIRMDPMRASTSHGVLAEGGSEELLKQLNDKDLLH